MERETPGGSDVGRDIERDLGDEPPPAIRDSRARTTSPRSTRPRRSAATRRRPSRRHRPSTPPSTTGRAPSDLHLPGVPAGRDAGPARSIRSTATRWPRHGAMSHAQPLLDAGSGGAAGRLHDRCRRLRHRRQRRPPAVVGRRAVRDPGRGDAQPRRAGRRRRPGPTRSPATAGSSARTPGDGWDAARILLPEVVGAPRHRARRRSDGS